MTKRARPLVAESHHQQPAAAHDSVLEVPATPGVDHDEVSGAVRVADAESHARRRQAFADGIRSIRTGGGTLNLGERTLMVVGGVIAPVGLVLVLLGWYGAARTPNLFEQVPYLISGGLFGLALVFLGAFFYFTHWVTELVKETRGQSAALIEAITRIENRLGPPVETVAAAIEPPAELVATERGSMAHRTDCPVVAGKTGLRPVEPADGLLPCKLCEPYAGNGVTQVSTPAT